jgi:PAS domain S-box-containing protein
MSEKSRKLRQRAEILLKATDQDMANMAARDLQQVVHELQVHQIELEMQNEELRRTQMDLETARDRYVELYDFSPAGHLSLDVHGAIVEANLRAAVLLDVHRKDLIGEPLARFIDPDDQAAFYRHSRSIMSMGQRQTCEVRLRKETGAICYIHLESLAVRQESGGTIRWRTAMWDVSDRQRAKQELVAQERQLQAIIETAMDAIITLDDRQRVVLFNRAAESIFCCAAADAIGQPLDRFIPARFREAHQAQLTAFAQPDKPPRSLRRLGELCGLRATGVEFPIEASVSQVTVNGRTLLTVILRDISERKAAADALQASNTFARAVLDSLSAHVCVLDKEGVILETNEAWKEFARHTSSGAVRIADVGQNYLDLCRRAIAEGKSTAGTFLSGIQSVLQNKQVSFATEYSCQVQGQQCWFLMRVTPLKGASAVVLSHMDISERVSMSRVLEDHVALLAKQRVELESLAGKLIEAQESERRRIARELHDDFNQRLAALSVELETIEQAVSIPSLPMVPQLAAARLQVGRLSDDLHDLAYRLHPSLLEHVGLEVAVRDHVSEFTQRTGLSVQFIADNVPDQLALEVATNLFRVMQESLHNVARHASATEVRMRLSGSSRGLGLSIRDDGKGFDSSNNAAHLNGLGLLSMQERMRLLGGFLRIHSVAGHGTKICAWVPNTLEAK